MSTLADCPRCGSGPVDATTVTGAVVLSIPTCQCYPHPPRCPFCATELDGDKCASVNCWAFGLVIPVPDIDPLWETT